MTNLIVPDPRGPEAQRFIREQAERAFTWAVGEWTAIMRAWMDGYLLPAVGGASIFESPIEAIFYVWWAFAGEVNGWQDELTLVPQHMVTAGGEQFRLDFAIAWPTLGAQVVPPLVGVELDGHDFHERTKEQVVRRNQRDRALHAEGWTLFHFSGSELIKNPSRCVEEVRVRAQQLLYEHVARSSDAR